LTGDWEAWLDFFADAVIYTAAQAVEMTQQLLETADEDKERINGLGRATDSALLVQRALMERPVANAGWLVKKTGITPATVNNGLKNLERLGIVTELTGGRRNRLFCYRKYLEIMNRGTELSR